MMKKLFQYLPIKTNSQNRFMQINWNFRECGNFIFQFFSKNEKYVKLQTTENWFVRWTIPRKLNNNSLCFNVAMRLEFGWCNREKKCHWQRGNKMRLSEKSRSVRVCINSVRAERQNTLEALGRLWALWAGYWCERNIALLMCCRCSNRILPSQVVLPIRLIDLYIREKNQQQQRQNANVEYVLGSQSMTVFHILFAVCFSMLCTKRRWWLAHESAYIRKRAAEWKGAEK